MKQKLTDKQVFYKSIFEKNPFVVDKDNRLTGIKCPACETGLLSIRYNDNGGAFIWECGFEVR